MKEASYRTTSFSKRPNMRSNTNIESTASFTTFTEMKKSFNDSGHTITGPIAMDPNPYPSVGRDRGHGNPLRGFFRRDDGQSTPTLDWSKCVD